MLAADRKWAIFHQREAEGELHVAPCYRDRLIVEHHVVDVLCPCRPTVEGETPEGKLIVVHNE